MEQEILFWEVTCYFKCKCELILNTIVWPFCQIPHHDMEVNVLAGLLSGKKCQVLQLHLAGVVQHSARVKTSLRDGHVVFDHWWNEWKGQRQTAPKWKTSSLFCYNFAFHCNQIKKKKEKWNERSNMTSLSRSDTFVSSCTWSRDEYGTNINQSKFTVSHFQATWSERLSTPCHVCSWHEEKAALVHALSVWGQRRNYKNLFCPESFSEFLTASQFLLSKKILYYWKKGHLVLIGLIHIWKPSSLWLLFDYYLHFLLSSFPAKQNIWASLCFDLGLCNNLRKQKQKKRDSPQ